MFKRKLYLILAAVMIMATSLSGVAFGLDFEGHWAEATIQKWFDDEKISGYEDGSFKPNNSITRAEFMTMVNSAYGFEELAEISYEDADAEEWYYVEIQKAVASGYIVGDSDEAVRPNDEISRQEVAVVMSRLNTLEENSDVSMFNDADKIAEWAVGYVGAVAEAEFMIGNDEGNFNPTDDITRAEALVSLDRSTEDKDAEDEEPIEEEEPIEGEEPVEDEDPAEGEESEEGEEPIEEDNETPEEETSDDNNEEETENE